MNYKSNHTTHRFRSLLSAVAVMLSVLLAGCSAADYAAVTTAPAADTQAVTETAALETESTSEETQETHETAAKGTTEPETEKEPETETETGTEEESTDASSGSELSVTMLDVGQGLSILIGQDGHYMLYDGGPRKSSSYVVAYLKQHGVTSLDYLISSHYDEDHIAGLVGVLHTTPVTTALTPDYTADSNIYESFISALDNSQADVIHPSAGDTYTFADSEFQVIGPKSYSYEGDNNNSICIRLTYGDFSCIMTGDAEEEAEADMVSSGLPLSADLYVAGHHGSSNSSSTAFVAAMSPSDVFISCGAGNSYGHPTEKALSVFQKNGCSIYRSDIQGEVTCYADGSSYWFSQEPCDDWAPGSKADQTVESASAAENTSVQEDAGGVQYIGNSHTKKFHLPSCPSVSNMKDSNKVEFDSRDEAISEGYVPCKQCNP